MVFIRKISMGDEKDDKDFVVCRRIIDHLTNMRCPNKETLNRIKVDICRELHVSMPKNSNILSYMSAEEKKNLLQILRIKNVRAASGVNVIAVMTKPFSCPKNRTVYLLPRRSGLWNTSIIYWQGTCCPEGYTKRI